MSNHVPIANSDAEAAPTRVTIENTGPLPRLVAVILIGAAIGALAHFLQAQGHIRDFATVAVIAIAFSISFWAHQRPDRVAVRFGPFTKIAEAIRDSLDDLRAWVYERPLKTGLLIAVGYGIAVLIGQRIIVALFSALYSWELAVAFCAVIAAVVTAPDFFKSILSRVTAPKGEQVPAPASGVVEPASEQAPVSEPAPDPSEESPALPPLEVPDADEPAQD